MSVVFFVLSLLFGDAYGQAKPKDFSKESVSLQKNNQFRTYCGSEVKNLQSGSIESALMAGLIFDIPSKNYPHEHKAFSGAEDSKKVCLKVSGTSGNTRRDLVIDLTSYSQLNGKIEFTTHDGITFNAVIAANMLQRGEKIPSLCDETWINISDEGQARSIQRRPNQADVCEGLMDQFHMDSKRISRFEEFLSVLIGTTKLYSQSKEAKIEDRIQIASDHLLLLNPILGVR